MGAVLGARVEATRRLRAIGILQWKSPPPAWLLSWLIWRFKNRPQPKPAGIPPFIPLWVWDVLKWMEWNRAGRLPSKRPPVDPTIPTIYWDVLKQLNREVPIPKKPPPPPPPPPPPSPPPPPPTIDNPLNYGRTAYVAWEAYNGSLGTPRQLAQYARARGFTRIAFQATPDNDAIAGVVRAAVLAEGLRFAVWFDVYHDGNQLAIIDWYQPQEYILNIESFARGPYFDIPLIRDQHPSLPLATVTNMWGLTAETVQNILIPAKVVAHVEAYRYEPGMNRPDLELQLQDRAHREFGWAWQDIQLTLGVKDDIQVDDYGDYDTNRYGIYVLGHLR